MKNDIICIHDCSKDGVAGALALYKTLGEDVKFVNPYEILTKELITDATVYLIGCCYSKRRMTRLLDNAIIVTVLDHNPSNEEVVSQLLKEKVISGKFDKTKSSAVLAWEWFHNTPVPELYKYIQDSTLQTNLFKETEDIIANLSSYPKLMNVWNVVLSMDIEEHKLEGLAINRSKINLVSSLIKDYSYISDVTGVSVFNINLLSELYPTLGTSLATDNYFSSVYHDKNDIRYYTLYSTKEGLDVGAIASLFKGGNGSETYASFSVPLNCLETINQNLVIDVPEDILTTLITELTFIFNNKRVSEDIELITQTSTPNIVKTVPYLFLAIIQSLDYSYIIEKELSSLMSISHDEDGVRLTLLPKLKLNKTK